jgi:hypothetical protein
MLRPIVSISIEHLTDWDFNDSKIQIATIVEPKVKFFTASYLKVRDTVYSIIGDGARIIKILY